MKLVNYFGIYCFIGPVARYLIWKNVEGRFNKQYSTSLFLCVCDEYVNKCVNCTRTCQKQIIWLIIMYLENLLYFILTTLKDIFSQGMSTTSYCVANYG